MITEFNRQEQLALKLLVVRQLDDLKIYGLTKETFYDELEAVLKKLIYSLNKSKPKTKLLKNWKRRPDVDWPD